jgi:uncharacterized protein (UPF0276 family)
MGVGAVWSAGLTPLLERDSSPATMVEVEPQTLWIATDAGYRVREGALERLRGLPQEILVHGVGFPLGGSCEPDPAAVELLQRFIEQLGAPWASEHLGFNEVRTDGGTRCTGWLLPLRQNEEGVDRAVRAITSVARRLSVPFAVENGVSYLEPRDDELSDGAFFGSVVDAADCGILLDLHNLHVNERNGRQSALDFIAEIPLERVWEIHVAAGMELDGFLLDSHSGVLDEPLLGLARHVVPRLPNLRAVTFELEPAMLDRLGLEAVEHQLVALGDVWGLRGSGDVREGLRRTAAPARGGRPSPSADEWEEGLGRLVAGEEPRGAFERRLGRDPGLALTRKLAGEARAGMCIGALPLTCRLIAVTLGPEALWAAFEGYWHGSDPQLFATREAEGFALHLAENPLEIEFLREVLAYERALLVAQRTGRRQETCFDHDPVELLTALHEGRRPHPRAKGSVVVPVPPLEPAMD